MANNSATGGYLSSTLSPLPGSLSLEDFIHNVIAGVSGISNQLVRPKYQTNPPKQPPLETDWIAFSIQNIDPDTFAYNGLDANGNDLLKRQQTIEIQCSFYGPLSYENVNAFIDGFQIAQNLEALQIANMGFKETSKPVRGPDLSNDRWVQRYEVSLFLVRQVVRTYPILSFASAMGTIHTDVEEPITIQWETGEPVP